MFNSVSLLLTTSHLLLLTEDYRFPVPRYQLHHKTEVHGEQFELTDQLRIQDVTHLVCLHEIINRISTSLYDTPPSPSPSTPLFLFLSTISILVYRGCTTRTH